MRVRERLRASGGGSQDEDDQSSSSGSTSTEDDAESTAERAARAAEMGAPVDADIKPATPEGTDQELTSESSEDSGSDSGSESSQEESQVEEMARGGGAFQGARTDTATEPVQSDDGGDGSSSDSGSDDQPDAGGNFQGATTDTSTTPMDGAGDGTNLPEEREDTDTPPPDGGFDRDDPARDGSSVREDAVEDAPPAEADRANQSVSLGTTGLGTSGTQQSRTREGTERASESVSIGTTGLGTSQGPESTEQTDQSTPNRGEQEQQREAPSEGTTSSSQGEGQEEQFGDFDWSFGLGDPDEDEVEQFVDETVGEEGTEAVRENVSGPLRSWGETAKEANLNANAPDSVGPAQAAGNLAIGAAGIAEGAPRLPAAVLEGAETGGYLIGGVAEGPQEATERGRQVAAAGTALAIREARRARNNPGTTAGEIVAGYGLGRAIGVVGRAATGSRAVPSDAEKARDLLRTDPEDLGSGQSSDLGTGGTGPILEADDVDAARGVSGPSRRSLATGRARRARDRIASGVESTRDRIQSSDGSQGFTDFVADDRAQASPTGLRRSDVDADSDEATEFTDFDGDTSTTGSGSEPSREVVLEDSPRDMMSDDVASRSLEQRRQNTGDFEGDQDRATMDPDRGSQRDRDLVDEERQRREEAEEPFEDADTDTPAGESTLADIQTGSGASAGAFAAVLTNLGAEQLGLVAGRSTPATWQGLGPLERAGPMGPDADTVPTGILGPGVGIAPTSDEDTDTTAAADERTGPMTGPGTTTDTTGTTGTDDPPLGRPGSGGSRSGLGRIGGPPGGGRGRRPRDDDDSDSSSSRSIGGIAFGGLSTAGDNDLSPDWLSQTITTIATQGGEVSSPSQSALEEAADDGVGGLPTEQMLGGSDETQEDIQQVRSLLSGFEGGSEFNLGGEL